MDAFQITITYQGQLYRMNVTQKEVSADLERYEVRAKNHVFLFDCNRPVMARQGISHVGWQWTLIAGKIDSLWFHKEIVQALESGVRNQHYRENR